MDEKARYERGLTQRRKVLGGAYVDRSIAARTDFNTEFQEIITRYAWGEIWTRPHFDERTRRILVIGTTMALDKWEEFRLHVRAALTEGGFSADDIKEIILQQMIYCGVPAANHAFRRGRRDRQGTRQGLSGPTREPTGRILGLVGRASSPDPGLRGRPDGGLQRSQGNAGGRTQHGDEFRKRYGERFSDPVFAPLRAEIDRILDGAWDAYSNSRKAPHTRRAGAGFADPDYELSVDWIAASERIKDAERQQRPGVAVAHPPDQRREPQRAHLPRRELEDLAAGDDGARDFRA